MGKPEYCVAALSRGKDSTGRAFFNALKKRLGEAADGKR